MPGFPSLLILHHVGSGGTYLFLEVWPARQAKNAAAVCWRSSPLLNLRGGCFGGSETSGILPFNIFDALPTHTVAGGYTRPIHTPHKTLPLSTRVTQQSRRGKWSKTGGFALAPQRCARRIVGAVEPEENRARSRSDPAIIHPRLAKELGQCLLLAQSGHHAAEFRCPLLGVKRT